MLSPPPSPLPPRANRSDDYFVLQNASERKSSIGRRYSLAILLIPLVLVFLSISSPRVRSLCHQSFVPLRELPAPNASLHFTSSHLSTKTRPAIAKRASTVPTVPTAASSAQSIVPTPFPQAFDLSLSWNFTTASCQNFFLNFTQSDSFRRCRPFSFLLGTSSQFTTAETNLTLLNDIIWGTCNTVESDSDCQSTMKSYGSGLQSQCKVELQQNTELVQEALIGFQLYEPMRQAGCLINNSTNSYCFLEAVANSSPSDLYFYQLPYGNLLPNGTVPSCSSCIQNVLSIYGHVVANPPTLNVANVAAPQNASIPQVGTQNVAAPTIPLDSTYSEAAQLASQECGSVYVQQASASSAIGVRVTNLYSIGLVLVLLLGYI